MQYLLVVSNVWDDLVSYFLLLSCCSCCDYLQKSIILNFLGFNSSCSRNLKHFGNPKKWKFAQKSQILWGKWISGRNVHKSADYWDTQFFLFSQKFHDQYFFPNCDSTQPRYDFFEDMPGFGLLHRFQKGSNFWKSNIQQLTYKQNSVWLVLRLNQNARTVLNFRSVF